MGSAWGRGEGRGREGSKKIESMEALKWGNNSRLWRINYSNMHISYILMHEFLTYICVSSSLSDAICLLSSRISESLFSSLSCRCIISLCSFVTSVCDWW